MIKIKEEIRNRLEDFKQIKQEDYVYELIFCLLTPQSNAKKCWQAVEELKQCEIQGEKLESCLKTKTRFYKNKAKYIKEALKKRLEIEKRVEETSESEVVTLRNWLADNVLGMGLKEASHFLRNIGKSDNQIAILDRHILRNLHALGVISKLPKALSKKIYLEIEQKMKDFAQKEGITLDELDLYFWSKETGSIFK